MKSQKMQKLYCVNVPSFKGSTLKGKDLLLIGANPFLLELTRKSVGMQKSKREITKFVSL